MKISYEILPSMAEVRISGRLTDNESSSVAEVIAALIAEGCRHVLVNLEVNFLSSVGLGAIVNFHSKLRELGGELAIYSLEKAVYKKLCMVPYPHKIFWDTREGAVKFLLRDTGTE